MLVRKINDKLRRFFKEDNRALLLTGARQTGKTFSIRKAGKECFEQFVEINLYNNKTAVKTISEATDAKDLLIKLSVLTKKTLIPGKTLIFFDEVQECKELVTAIKFLVDEGSYRYVMSGSLLGIEMKDIRSIPVGYMSVMEMYPLDLEEFANALGIIPDAIGILRRCFDERTEVDGFLHSKMMELVRFYLLIGGMPAAVQRYLDTNNMKNVMSVQRDIIRLYRKDITRYDPSHKLQIEEIYNLIPSELNAKNKRFILKDLNEKCQFRRYKDSFVWLSDAGVAIPCYNIEEPKAPMLLNKQHNLFKLFLNDVGLLASLYAGDIQVRILNGETSMNFGAIYENLAAQELYCHGFGEDFHNLYYYNSKKQGELDFVIEDCGGICPIEIKSGKDYHRHNALDNILSDNEYDIQSGYVFCHSNIHAEGKIVYLPIYMLMFLQKQEIQELTVHFDPGM